MTFDFADALQKAAEPLGVEAFHLVAKLMIDGPPKGLLSSHDWLQAQTSRAPTDAEFNQAAFVAAVIAQALRRSLVGLFCDEDFRAALKRGLQRDWSKKEALKRHNSRTSVFAAAVASSPDATTKEIIRRLEAEGALLDRGKDFEHAGSGKRISKATIPSKVSRERKKLRNK